MPLNSIPEEIHNQERIGEVGHCIYCGSTEDLSDEHVLPLSLGGKLLLPLASCAICRDITSEFERRVARGFMLAARTVAKLPTRRKADRPKTFSLGVGRPGITEQIDVPADQYPAFLFLPLLAPATYLNSRQVATGVEIVGHEVIHFGKAPEDVARDLDTKTISNTFNWDITAFARLLAKAAYGYAVAACGQIPRPEVPVLPLILGDADDASAWLGSAIFTHRVEAQKPLHSMGLRIATDPSTPGGQLLIAQVKLFANAGATGYEVVVWKSPTPLDHLK